jgi:hypothetical protein
MALPSPYLCMTFILITPSELTLKTSDYKLDAIKTPPVNIRVLIYSTKCRETGAPENVCQRMS